ncbi:MAG TPA: hypothetical protein VG890_03690 [Puia sp.]|nr:hypothetical protein [Puia sp.]
MPAKKKSSSKPGEEVLVDSRAYGKHTRAARGSKSKAVLNPAMKAHGRRLRKSNAPAKLITDALRPFRENFKGGMIWQRLVKHFSAQAKKGEAYSVRGIGIWDLNEQYFTSRLMSAGVRVKPNDDFSMLEISVNYSFSKRFLERKKDITAFRITLIFLFPDFKNNDIVTIPVILPDKALTDTTSRSFVVDIPRRANSYLVCFKAEACKDGAIYQNTSHVDKAMCLIASGMKD